jgi:hypothetical protein
VFAVGTAAVNAALDGKMASFEVTLGELGIIPRRQRGRSAYPNYQSTSEDGREFATPSTLMATTLFTHCSTPPSDLAFTE